MDEHSLNIFDWEERGKMDGLDECGIRRAFAYGSVKDCRCALEAKVGRLHACWASWKVEAR